MHDFKLVTFSLLWRVRTFWLVSVDDSHVVCITRLYCQVGTTLSPTGDNFGNLHFILGWQFATRRTTTMETTVCYE